MLLPRSKLAAQRSDRPYLAPLWLLILLGGLIALALVIIYPQKNLVDRITQAPDSELSRDYLANLLRTDPNNPKLRLLLARQMLAKGDLAALRETLRPALNAGDPDLHREALWLLWLAEEREYKSAQREDQRTAQRKELGRQLKALADEQWSDDRLIEIAGKAFSLGETSIGVELFEQLAKRRPDSISTANSLAEAARSALANGQYSASAELYLLARKKTTNQAQAKRYFLSALSTLQSGNLLKEALQVAEKEIDDLSEDSDTLFFLTNLARAAGRPDIADRYVRKLLRLSLLQQLEMIRLAAAHAGAVPQKAAFRQVDRSKDTADQNRQGPQIPFDEKTYALGYTVFLENRKLEDAWKVAASAVRQVPDDTLWRERLAKVSEWTQRPQMALDNWLHLARKTRRDDAWQSVLRLAPGLFNDEAIIAGLQYELSRRPGEQKLLRELIAAWERQGEPGQAIAYLTQLSHRHDSPHLLETLADLEERAGQPDQSLKTWQRLLGKPEHLTPQRAFRAALQATLRGNNAQALAWLESVRPRNDSAAPLDREFWQLLGRLAELEQRDGLAIDAYTQLTAGPNAEEADFDTLRQLLTDNYPLEAAKVATRSWQRFDQPANLLLALNFHASRQQWSDMGALLKQLDPAPDAPRRSLTKLRKQPEFLRLAAAYHQNTGQLDLARKELGTALQLAPDSREIQQNMIWLLIDSNDAPALRRLLASREAAWRNDSTLHDALAAAYLALSRPKVALERYLTPRLAAHQDDFLWLMNYADALDQNQQSDRAWRMRRHLLSQEWQAAHPGGNAAVNDKNKAISTRRAWLDNEQIDATRRVARARLLIIQRSGDTGLDALRELLRLDRGGEQRYSNAAVESMLGWFQGAGEYSAERGHLWQQYSRSLSKPSNRPLWAEISVALADDNGPLLGQMLDDAGERLPRYDRINAARRIGDLRSAQSDAFDTQDEQSDDDPLHMQLTESLLAFSDHGGGTLSGRNLGAFSEQQASSAWHLAITPQLSLDLELGRIQRHNVDQAIIRNLPDERFTSLRMNWQERGTQFSLLAEDRHSLSNYQPRQVEYEHRIDDRLSLRIGLGQNLPSQDSSALRVAGMKDRQAASLNYQISRYDRISLERFHERYELQTGSALGRGQHTSVVYAHTLRQDSRDLELSAFWSAHRFSREDNYSDAALNPLLPTSITGLNEVRPAFFLPESFNFYGLRLSTDIRYEREYTRGIRPYASLARTWHTALGPGYDTRLGLAGSLLGADHFSLTWGLARGGPQNGALTRDLNFNYRMHY